MRPLQVCCTAIERFVPSTLVAVQWSVSLVKAEPWLRPLTAETTVRSQADLWRFVMSKVPVRRIFLLALHFPLSISIIPPVLHINLAIDSIVQ